MNENTQKTVAEYFAGIGLVRMGLQVCGWKVLFANDISSKKYKMYDDFYRDANKHYVIGDVFKLNPESIPNTILATCSFPCIDLSLAGNMNGMMNGKHSSAFWGFVRVLKRQGDKAPKLLLVENVPGWLSSNKGEDFRITVETLNRLGYACDVFVLDALRFVPQSRLRVFLVGVKTNDHVHCTDFILKRPTSLINNQLRQNIIKNRGLRWYCHDIPEPPPKKQAGLSELIEYFPDSDPRWWPEQEVKRHLNMMNELHRNRIKQLAHKCNFSYRTFYRRRRDGVQRAEVRNDDLSGCLRTAVGGSGKQFILRAGKNVIKMRAMTPREYARLQGVSDKYLIKSSDVQALTGFGDAVAVPVITWIAKNVLDSLLKISNNKVK